MITWHNTIARKTAAVILALACALPALAQDPPQTPTPPAPQARPIPTRTVGLEPGKVVRWTLRDAIIAALEKNVDIEIERENVRLAQFDLFASYGAYDPVTTSTFTYSSTTQPNAFIFSGTNQAALRSRSLVYNFGIAQAIERTGGDFQVNFNNTRSLSNTNNFSPQYSPQLTATYTQPLMKNFRTDASRRSIKLAKKRLDLSDAQFRQRAIEIISRVQQAYWDLAFAIRDEEIQRDAVKLAETQLANNQRQVEVGTLAPIDVISAATSLESRRQQVFQAMNSVSQAENALKVLTVDGPNADLWTAQIIPVESFEVQPVSLPLADAFKLAVENRLEMKQFALQRELNQIDVEYFRNQTKPQVDAFVTYTLFGLGGTPRAGVPPNTIVPGFIGGYGTALSNLFSQDFRTWRFGVNFSLPLRNRTAEANLGRTLEAGRQLDLQTRRQIQNIEVEVRNAVQSVETAKMRIEASRAQREYAQQQYDGEEKKFQAGLSTTFLVLTRQTELAQARGSELRALTDYNKAVAELQRIISTTLSSNNIEVKSEVDPNAAPGSGKK
jgi:outer membrane protein